jgi:hypothetical protein
MIRIRIALLALVVVTGLLAPTLSVAAPLLGHRVSVVSVVDGPDPGETKPANCGTANTPPCEA